MFSKDSLVTEKWYYDAKIDAKLNEKGSIFGVVIPSENVDEYVTQAIADLIEEEDVYVPSSNLLKGGYGLFGEVLKDEYRLVKETLDNGEVNLELTELKQNSKYFVYLSAGNDLPHFKKDLLKDTRIQKLTFKTKQNLNLYYGDDSTV